MLKLVKKSLIITGVFLVCSSNSFGASVDEKNFNMINKHYGHTIDYEKTKNQITSKAYICKLSTKDTLDYKKKIIQDSSLLDEANLYMTKKSLHFPGISISRDSWGSNILITTDNIAIYFKSTNRYFDDFRIQGMDYVFFKNNKLYHLKYDGEIKTENIYECSEPQGLQAIRMKAKLKLLEADDYIND